MVLEGRWSLVTTRVCADRTRCVSTASVFHGARKIPVPRVRFAVMTVFVLLPVATPIRARITRYVSRDCVNPGVRTPIPVWKAGCVARRGDAWNRVRRRGVRMGRFAVNRACVSTGVPPKTTALPGRFVKSILANVSPNVRSIPVPTVRSVGMTGCVWWENARNASPVRTGLFVLMIMSASAKVNAILRATVKKVRMDTKNVLRATNGVRRANSVTHSINV